MSCDELVTLCRNHKKSSYSCHAVLLKPFQIVGETRSNWKGFNVFQLVGITLVVILCPSVSIWLSVACKHMSEGCPIKNCFCVHYVCKFMICQEPISENPKTQDYSERPDSNPRPRHTKDVKLKLVGLYLPACSSELMR